MGQRVIKDQDLGKHCAHWCVIVYKSSFILWDAFSESLDTKSSLNAASKAIKYKYGSFRSLFSRGEHVLLLHWIMKS